MEVKWNERCLVVSEPMDYTVHGILQASMLKWVAFPLSKGSSQPRNQAGVSCIAARLYQLSSEGGPESAGKANSLQFTDIWDINKRQKKEEGGQWSLVCVLVHLSCDNKMPQTG